MTFFDLNINLTLFVVALYSKSRKSKSIYQEIVSNALFRKILKYKNVLDIFLMIVYKINFTVLT